MPREKKPLCAPIYARLEPSTDAALRAYAEADRREISEVVRIAVNEFLSARGLGARAPRLKRTA